MTTRGMYQGKYIEDMTREELMDAVMVLGTLYQNQIKESIRQLNLISSFRKKK